MFQTSFHFVSLFKYNYLNSLTPVRTGVAGSARLCFLICLWQCHECAKSLTEVMYM